MTTIWSAVSPYQVQLWSLVTVIFGALVARAMRLRPKVNFSIHHSSSILVDEPLLDEQKNVISPNQIVKMASIVVVNSGLNPARGLEVAFNWKPRIMNVFPARAFSEIDSAFNRYSIKFDSLAPKEQTTINIMAINADLPAMTAVRCDECEGKEIAMGPQRIWPTWFLRGATAVLLVGLVSSVYLLIRILQTLAS